VKRVKKWAVMRKGGLRKKGDSCEKKKWARSLQERFPNKGHYTPITAKGEHLTSRKPNIWMLQFMGTDQMNVRRGGRPLQRRKKEFIRDERQSKNPKYHTGATGEGGKEKKYHASIARATDDKGERKNMNPGKAARELTNKKRGPSK